jgi:hypothetical protein
MLADIKRDFMITFAIVGVILTFGFCCDAQAQTTQPVYTRPSKGAVLTTFNATVSATVVTSVTFDWTAFSSANVSVKFATASGTRCACPSGVDNCYAAFQLGYKTSTSKTGPFGDIENSSITLPIGYNPTAPATEPAVFAGGQFNIGDPYVQFFTAFTDYKDSVTGNPVAGCFLTVAITPIPFTGRLLVEGPYTGIVPSTSQINPVMSGGPDYVPPNGGGQGATLYAMRVNATGVVAVGGGSGNPLLPATSPVAVNAATLVYTATVNQRGVRLQNVGANPALCAAGANASSVAAGRYSFALAAAATAGAGGTFDVTQLDTRNSASNGKVYCLGSGGATSIAILPY